MSRLVRIMAFCVFLAGMALTAEAGSPAPIGPQDPQSKDCGERTRTPEPTCGLEITCADKPLLLGYSEGVCFRATCAGVWALVHTRLDQASFRRRLFSYRHYRFRGTWELKDQGTIEAGPASTRELFLVLPDDLIELKLTEPDPFAKIAVENLGYVKKGSIPELARWLAFNIYMEKVDPLKDDR